jgi:glycerol-3-phosphate acyltransferase PlsY
MQSWWLWLVLAYLSGSIPCGWLIAAGRGVDIRKAGSGNVGATNVGRVLGRRWGALCFTLDLLKGLLPVLAAGWALHILGRATLQPVEAWTWLGVAAAAIVGHVWPVWLKFRGGKGVATALGAFLGFYPILTFPGLAAAVVWLLFASTFRYVSLASIVGALTLWTVEVAAACAQRDTLTELLASAGGRPSSGPAPAWVQALLRWPPLPMAVVTTLLAALVLWRHRSNFHRLLAGTESRLGERRSDSPHARG